MLLSTLLMLTGCSIAMLVIRWALQRDELADPFAI